MAVQRSDGIRNMNLKTFLILTLTAAACNAASLRYTVDSGTAQGTKTLPLSAGVLTTSGSGLAISANVPDARLGGDGSLSIGGTTHFAGTLSVTGAFHADSIVSTSGSTLATVSESLPWLLRPCAIGSDYDSPVADFTASTLKHLDMGISSVVLDWSNNRMYGHGTAEAMIDWSGNDTDDAVMWFSGGTQPTVNFKKLRVGNMSVEPAGSGTTVIVSGTMATTAAVFTSGSAYDSTARTTKDYLRSVDYYGADPTGVTDSSAAFSAALAVAGPSPVLLGSGTYRLPNGFPQLTQPGQGWWGVGESATVVLITSATASGVQLSPTFDSGIIPGPVTVRDMTITGTNGNTSTGAGMLLRHPSGDFIVCGYDIANVRIAGFKYGIYAENSPLLNIRNIDVQVCRSPFLGVKVDSGNIDGWECNVRTTGNFTTMPEITGTETVTMFEFRDSTGTPSGPGNHFTIENVDGGDVDEVLRVNGSQPVRLLSCNFERIGTVHTPPEGDHLVYITNSLGSFHFENWRIGGTPTGSSGTSAMVVINNDTDAAPVIRLEGMTRAQLGANYSDVIVTGTFRSQVNVSSDGSGGNTYLRKLTMSSGSDSWVPPRIPFNNDARGPFLMNGLEMWGAAEAGKLKLYGTSGITPHITFNTYGTDRWRIYNNGQDFYIDDILGNRTMLQLNLSGSILLGGTAVGSAAFSSKGDFISGTGGTLTGAITGSGTTGVYIHLPKTTGAYPPTPSDGITIFSGSMGRLSWTGTNGFKRTFDAQNNTADRVYTLPNADVTLVGDTDAQTVSNKILTGGTLTSPVISGGVMNGGTLAFASGTAKNIATPDVATSGTSATDLMTPATVRNVLETTKWFFEKDDFACGANATGSVGELGWQYSVASSAGSTSQNNNIGLFVITTSTATNNVSYMWQSSGSQGPIPEGDAFPATPGLVVQGFDSTFVGKISATDAIVADMGFFNSSNAAFTRGQYLEYNAATDTNWMACCTDTVSGTTYTTRTSTGVAASTNFVKVRIYVTTTDQISFSVNDGAPITITTNVPTSAGSNYYPKWMVTNSGTATRSITADYFTVRIPQTR